MKEQKKSPWHVLGNLDLYFMVILLDRADGRGRVEAVYFAQSNLLVGGNTGTAVHVDHIYRRQRGIPVCLPCVY